MKKGLCQNTYFNREIAGYIELLLSADKLLTSLEESYGNESGRTLEVSRQLDTVIADIMERRGTVSQILSADSAFS